MAAPSIDPQELRLMGTGALTGNKMLVNPLLDGALNPTSFKFISSNSFSLFEIAVAAPGEHYGARLDLDTSVDISTYQWLVLRMAYEEFNLFDKLDTLANGGMSLYLYDTSGNYKEWSCHGNEWQNRDGTRGGWQHFTTDARAADVFLDLNYTPKSESGTLNLTAVAGVEVHVRFIASDTTVPMGIGRISVSNPLILKGGELGDKANFLDVAEYFSGQSNQWTYYKGFFDFSAGYEGQVGKGYSCRKGVSVGDGVTETHFEDTGFSLSMYPSARLGAGATFNIIDGSMPHVICDGDARVFTVNQSASDIVTFRDGRWSGYAGGDWSWSCIGDSAGECNVISCGIFDAKSAGLGHSNNSGVSYTRVDDVEVTTSSVMSSCFIVRSEGKGLYVAGGPGDYSSVEVTLKDEVATNHVTIADGAAGDYTLTGLSAGHVINIHNESVTSAITVFVNSGLPYTTTTAGGVVTVSAPPVSVLITALDQITKAPIEGAAVYIEAGAAGGIAQGTELANGLTNASGVLSVSLSVSSAQSIQNSSVRKASSAPHYTAFPLDGIISTISGLTITALMISEDS